MPRPMVITVGKDRHGNERRIARVATRERVRYLRGAARQLYFDALATDYMTTEQMIQSFQRWRVTPEGEQACKERKHDKH